MHYSQLLVLKDKIYSNIVNIINITSKNTVPTH